MKKQWRDLKTFSLEVHMYPEQCRPREQVMVFLYADMDEEVRVEFDLPVDLQADSMECRITDGKGTLRIKPRIPGEFAVRIARIHSSLAGCFISGPLGKVAFGDKAVKVAHLSCAWDTENGMEIPETVNGFH